MSKVEAAMWIGVWAAIAQLAFVLVNDRLLSQRKLERRSIEKLRSRLSSRSQPATFSHITRTERFFSLSVLLVLFYTVFGYSLTTIKTNFWLWALAVTVYHWNLVYLVTNGIFKNRTTEKQNCILIITELTSMGIAFFMLFWLSKILPIYAIVVVVVSAVVSLQMLISLLRKPLGTYKTVIISESLAAVGLVLGSVAQRSLSSYKYLTIFRKFKFFYKKLNFLFKQVLEIFEIRLLYHCISKIINMMQAVLPIMI